MVNRNMKKMFIFTYRQRSAKSQLSVRIVMSKRKKKIIETTNGKRFRIKKNAYTLLVVMQTGPALRENYSNFTKY